MSDQSAEILEELRRATAGDPAAVNRLFAVHQERLKRMVRLRMHPHVRQRIDDSDVVQECFLDAARKLPDYLREPQVPFYLWLRHLTELKLTELHRRHLCTQMRDARRDVSLFRGPLPEADTAHLAAQLLGKLTSPSQAAIRAEMKRRLQEALSSMDPVDRELLALRHFEQLSNAETARVMELPESTTSDRHLRAIKRLQRLLAESTH